MLQFAHYSFQCGVRHDCQNTSFAWRKDTKFDRCFSSFRHKYIRLLRSFLTAVDLCRQKWRLEIVKSFLRPSCSTCRGRRIFQSKKQMQWIPFDFGRNFSRWWKQFASLCPNCSLIYGVHVIVSEKFYLLLVRQFDCFQLKTCAPAK